MGWFNGLGSKISNAANYLGSKINQGASFVGSKLNSIGGVVGGVAAKLAPGLAAINPELGAAAAGVAAAAKTAQSVGQGLSAFANRAG